MRTLRPLVLSTICFIPSIGMAFDVGYQLNNKALVANEEPKAADPVAIAITDRVWAAPGIEQAYSDLAPAREFDFTAPSPVRVIHAGTRGWVQDEGPQWLDNVAWPRTRELYGLGQSRAYAEEHQFSGFTYQLQR